MRYKYPQPSKIEKIISKMHLTTSYSKPYIMTHLLRETKVISDSAIFFGDELYRTYFHKIYKFSTTDYKMIPVEDGRVPMSIVNGITLFDTVLIPIEGVCYLVELVNANFPVWGPFCIIFISKPAKT